MTLFNMGYRFQNIENPLHCREIITVAFKSRHFYLLERRPKKPQLFRRGGYSFYSKLLVKCLRFDLCSSEKFKIFLRTKQIRRASFSSFFCLSNFKSINQEIKTENIVQTFGYQYFSPYYIRIFRVRDQYRKQQ